jgi:diguanylate cyclase (GGDEF)-like protein
MSRVPSRLASRFASLCLVLAVAGSIEAASHERAFRLLTTYSTADQHAGSQNFCVTESARGVMYIGNLAGVLEYDGAWWRLIKIGDELPGVALSPLPDGRVAVGSVEDFGYLEPDPAGLTRYVSLRNQLPAKEREIGRINRIHQTRDGVIFVADSGILLWTSSGVRTVVPLPAEAGRSFLVDGVIWVRMPNGMQRLVNGKLELIPGGELFAKDRASLILPTADGRHLAVIRHKGIFLFDGVKLEPFAPEASARVNRDTVMSGHRLADGRFAIVTYRGGVILLRPDGEIDEVIDQSVGLPEFDLSNSFIARDGSMLLAGENGVTRIEVSSALAVVDSRGGMRGGAQTAIRHRGTLYVGTTGGFYSVNSKTPQSGGLETNLDLVKRIGGEAIESCWSLLSAGDDLIVGTGVGIGILRPNGAMTMVDGTADEVVYSLRQSHTDPTLYYVGSGEGLGALRHRGDQWTWEGKVAGFDGAVRNIVEESNGVLWLGTTYNGAVRTSVTSKPGEPLKVTFKEFTTDEVSVYQVAGRTLFSSNGPHLMHFDEARQRFEPDPVLGHLGNGSIPWVVAEDARGNVWMNTQPVGVALRKPNGEFSFDDKLLIDMPGRDVQMIYADEGEVVWFGTEKGLVRYDGHAQRADVPPRTPLVRQVTVDGKPVKVENGKVTIQHGSGRIRFEVSPVSYEPNLMYQYRLDPNDTGWSAWTTEPFTEFTNLWEGDYRLELRTRNIRNTVSPVQAWSFTIRPPWYRTSWAYALWVALLMLLVALVSKVRNKQLRRRAAELEARVAEQTHELIEKNHALEHANVRLEQLSFDDPLTGIPNRRHFEETLRAEWNRAWRSGTSLGFVLMDIDSFKELNDTRGHHVGDDCLRQIGTFLESSLRRSGDFAARYGGEEFALVLPNTELEGATHFAEQLRAGIEALGMPNPGAAYKVLTSSFGVAAVRPNESATPDDLLVAADRALYRAKAAGRNRVGVADSFGQMTA